MKPKSAWLIVMAACLGLVLVAPPASAVGPRDVKANAKETAEFLAQKGDAALAEINKGGKWKEDPYVFVLDLKGTMLAHPLRPQMAGRSMASIKDVKGNSLVGILLAPVKANGHGWSEYWIPKPGEMKPSRKTAYCLKVSGKEWAVCSGAFGYTKEQAIKEAGN